MLIPVSSPKNSETARNTRLPPPIFTPLISNRAPGRVSCVCFACRSLSQLLAARLGATHPNPSFHGESKSKWPSVCARRLISFTSTDSFFFFFLVPVKVEVWKLRGSNPDGGTVLCCAVLLTDAGALLLFSAGFMEAMLSRGSSGMEAAQLL